MSGFSATLGKHIDDPIEQEEINKLDTLVALVQAEDLVKRCGKNIGYDISISVKEAKKKK